MTPEETVAATKSTIVGRGGAFMRHPDTFARGEELGLRGWTSYYAGRCGVLGPAPADVVTAAMVFFPPALVAKTWGKVAGVLAGDDGPSSLDEIVAAYAECAAAWGRAHLDGVEGLDDFCAVAEELIGAADIAGLPLFAGWRGVTVVDDAPGRAAQLLHVLREHRGGIHGLVVLSSGMTPLEAVVSGRGGEDNARFFGWPEPYPDAAGLHDRRAEAEAHTDMAVAAHYAHLDADALTTLSHACTAISEHLRAQ